MNAATPVLSISPERTLAALAAAGDAEATGKLLRILAPRMARVVRAVLGAGHPDVDDAIQVALVGLVQALPAYRGDTEPAGYARIIAVRAAIAARKRGRLDHARREDEDDLEDDRPSPGADVESRQRKELLRSLLGELPIEQAETLALRVVLGCSLDEVAKQMNVPLNTVRSRVRVAKGRLRARIESDPAFTDLLTVDERYLPFSAREHRADVARFSGDRS